MGISREEAIKGLKALRREFSGYEPNEEMLDMAIKALEQEPILDKIRAEITQDAFNDVNGSKFIFVNRVNQIIDKYKAESEDT